MLGLRGGGWQYHDVIFILTVIAGCLVGLAWLLRRTGTKEAADAWEADIRAASARAERHGWHSVLQWHRKFGYDKAPITEESRKASLFSGILIVFAVAALVGLLAWATR